MKTKKFLFPKRANSLHEDLNSQNTINTTVQKQYGPFQQFKVSLDTISKNNNGECIPLCVKEAVVFIRQHLDEEGLFRRSGSQIRIKEIQELYNTGQPVAYEDHEVHVAACVLKAFYRELPESLLPETIFNELMSLQVLDLADKVEVAKDLMNAKLPPAAKDIDKQLRDVQKQKDEAVREQDFAKAGTAGQGSGTAGSDPRPAPEPAQ